MDETTQETGADDESAPSRPKVEKFKVVMPRTELGERGTFKVSFIDDDGNPIQEPVITDVEGPE